MSLDIQLPNGKSIRYADEKAALFFVTDASAVGEASYDAWVASTNNPPHALTSQDLHAINTTMRGRSGVAHWERFMTGAELPWLKVIDSGWDLIEMPDADWARQGCADRIQDALAALDGPYHRAAVVTKLLHIKRPRLIPICDSLVSATMGRPAWDATSTASLIFAIRETGQANLGPLASIADRLESIGIARPLVRILDALLWFGAPFSGSLGPYGLFEEWLVQWHGGRLFF